LTPLLDDIGPLAPADNGIASLVVPLHGRVLVLCALVAFLDGFDTQSIGPAAAPIADTLGVPLSAFGAVFGTTQVGFLLGAMSFSALGDRFGRRRMLVVATLLFAVASLATALSGSLTFLLASRFLSGLGLGGATPNFIGLASEFSPMASRARIVTTLWAAVPFGGMAGAFASSISLPILGWQAMFYLGFAAPVGLIPVLLAAMPESRETRWGDDASPGTKIPVAELFSDGRALPTIWLWLASFMTWMVLVVVALWTPALMKQAGISASSAALVLAFNNGGGILGTIAMGWAVGKIRPHIALIVVFPAAAIFIAAIGWEVGIAMAAPFAVVAVTSTLAGAFSSAAGGGIVGVSASAYPGAIRATGAGWAIGVGRIGSIIGPLLVGALIARGWAVPDIYLAIALPALMATGFIWLLARR
jgi:AAHS family 4-hydroxybenzoate transporter-like MFS transporter